MLAVLAVTALVSPWVTWAMAGFTTHSYSFARVFDRVFEVLLVIAMLLAWRPLDLGGATEIGLRGGRPAHWLGRGLAIGVAGLAVGLAVCWLFGGIEIALRYPPAKTVRKAFLGLCAAVAIGVGEEALFRGVLLRRLRRDAGPVVAVVVSTLVYAVVHVLRVRHSVGPVDAWAGIAQARALLAPLASGAAAPEVGGLVLLGLLLAMARLRTGSLWTPIGIHAAWVAVFRVGRLFFDLRQHPTWLVGGGWPPLVGGAAGWIAAAVCALLLCRTSPR